MRNFGLDILRTLAILSVVFFHTLGFVDDPPKWLVPILQRGWMGVDLFFVLSGFLIANQVFSRRENESFQNFCHGFWVRRWTRTLPLYFSILFLYIVIKPLVLGIPFYGFNWKFFVFLQNFGSIKDFGQTWSLCIEEQFYLVFPLIAFFLRRSPPWVWLVPAFVSMAIRWFSAQAMLSGTNQELAISDVLYLETFRFKTIAMLDAISIGVFLAASKKVWSHFSPVSRNAIGLCGLVVLILTASSLTEFPKRPDQISMMYFLIAISFGALLIAMEQIQKPVRFLGFSHYVALWSYSAYLWHQMFSRFIDRYLGTANWLVQVTVYLGLTFFCSWCTYILIEKPGMALRKRLEPAVPPSSSLSVPII